jgi:transcriptional regulator with XRE-family HTH domain
MDNELLRQAREGRGESRRELASQLRIAVSSVERWEAGARPSEYMQRRLCAYFGKSLEELGFRRSEDGKRWMAEVRSAVAERSLARALMGMWMASERGSGQLYGQMVRTVLPWWLEQGWGGLGEWHVRQGIGLGREQKAWGEVGRLLCWLAEVLIRREAYGEARGACEAGWRLAEEVGDEAWESEALGRLSFVSLLCGDRTAARSYLAQGWARVRRGRGGLGELWRAQGAAACVTGEYASAQRWYERSLLLPERGDRGIVYALLFLVASVQGEQAQALEYFARAGSLENVWVGQEWWVRLTKSDDRCAGQTNSDGSLSEAVKHLYQNPNREEKGR